MRSPDFLTAAGIGVADLDRSARFYREVVGMTETQRFHLDHMEEIVLAHEGRPGVILMHWTDGSAPSYANLPIKLVFYVQDAAAMAQRVRDAGLPVTREPEALESLGGAKVCLARDPDGYVVEFIERPARPASTAAAAAQPASV
ncbi:MAG TPA: VOC family protein [Caulobacteraceae bacterium]|jgi:predicted enzyme related to lactoylglutathione lyase|nr:VOC family protein [Caulobacteraceae bacterium]